MELALECIEHQIPCHMSSFPTSYMQNSSIYGCLKLKYQKTQFWHMVRCLMNKLKVIFSAYDNNQIENHQNGIGVPQGSESTCCG